MNGEKKKGIAIKTPDFIWGYRFLHELASNSDKTFFVIGVDYLHNNGGDLEELFKNLFSRLKEGYPDTASIAADYLSGVIVSKKARKSILKRSDLYKILYENIKHVTPDSLDDFKTTILSLLKNLEEDTYVNMDDLNIAFNLLNKRHLFIYTMLGEHSIQDKTWQKLYRQTIQTYFYLQHILDIPDENIYCLFDSRMDLPEVFKSNMDVYKLESNPHDLYNTLSQKDYFADSIGLMYIYGYLNENPDFVAIKENEYSLQGGNYVQDDKKTIREIKAEMRTTDKKQNISQIDSLSPFIWIRFARWLDNNESIINNPKEDIDSYAFSPFLKAIINDLKQGFQKVFTTEQYKEYMEFLNGRKNLVDLIASRTPCKGKLQGLFEATIGVDLHKALSTGDSERAIKIAQFANLVLNHTDINKSVLGNIIKNLEKVHSLKFSDLAAGLIMTNTIGLNLTPNGLGFRR